MISYDVCLAWNWVGDAEFVSLFEEACKRSGLSLLLVNPANLGSVMQSLVNNQMTFRAFFDRASDSDTGFMPLVQWARNQAVYHINPLELASHTQDKAFMHTELIKAGIYTPYTIVLPSYEECPQLAEADLSPLGRSFAIKPAHGGGGEGVVIEATSWDQVSVSRKQHPKDKYLLQAHITPIMLGQRPAWFRVIYCAGQVYPCWWTQEKRIYEPVSPSEEALFQLASLRSIAASLARVCGLELFSTEIALTESGLFIVVDYINDQIDLRLQSKAADGVPDDVVCDIATRLVALVAVHCLPAASSKQEACDC